jgi:L-serine dehydratase
LDISVFDIFSIGIGPSSSHTMGPMLAARSFICEIDDHNLLTEIVHITVELFGSLAHTGKGHGTDGAVMLGLEGSTPGTIDPAYLGKRPTEIAEQRQISLLSKHCVHFDPQADLLFNTSECLPGHPNAMRFSAYNKAGQLLESQVYYSVGGGFIIREGEQPSGQAVHFPFKFDTARELIGLCVRKHLAIKDVVLANECSRMTEAHVRECCLRIRDVMCEAIERGCVTRGVLPGSLHLERRAPALYEKLKAHGMPRSHEETGSVDWLDLYAIAVCEENASGGRIVTAPTNGAAGIIPAVLNYYARFYPQVTDDAIVDFLLTAGAIGILFKKGASISGAEVGCQGEVGVACSMAAGALAAVLGGTLGQIENAAEIAMEHMLGLTCDPVGGLVQIPCIERNAMAAVTALNAAHLALLGEGKHYVSLDAVISTMKQTGEDMSHKYKETSLGGLAANVTFC